MAPSVVGRKRIFSITWDAGSKCEVDCCHVRCWLTRSSGGPKRKKAIERCSKHMEEQTVDALVRDRQQGRTVGVPVPHFVKESPERGHGLSAETFSERIRQQTVDEPVPYVVEEILEEITEGALLCMFQRIVVDRGRVSERLCAQTVNVSFSRFDEQFTEVPILSDQDQTISRSTGSSFH